MEMENEEVEEFGYYCWEGKIHRFLLKDGTEGFAFIEDDMSEEKKGILTKYGKKLLEEQQKKENEND